MSYIRTISMLVLLALAGCSVAQRPVKVIGTSERGIALETRSGIVHVYEYPYRRKH